MLIIHYLIAILSNKCNQKSPLPGYIVRGLFIQFTPESFFKRYKPIIVLKKHNEIFDR